MENGPGEGQKGANPEFETRFTRKKAIAGRVWGKCLLSAKIHPAKNCCGRGDMCYDTGNNFGPTRP